MPPKPKKGKKKAANKEPIDDVDTTVLTREKLEKYCIQVNEEIEKEIHNSNFLRLDRDKLANMVAIAREQLVSARDANRVKQIELENAEDEHRIVMWENRQKLINLLSEKNIATLNSQVEYVRKNSLEQINHEERMNHILCDISELKKEIQNLDVIYDELKKKEEIAHAENKSQIRQTDKEMHLLMESKREKIFGNKFKELEARFGLEYKIAEKIKNQEINQLIKNNVKLTSDLKHYYNQIVNHNLSVMNMMKQEFQQLKRKSAATEKQCLQLRKENQFLFTSFNQTQMEEQLLREKLVSAGKDKNQLKCIKTELENIKIRLEQKKVELDVLKMRLDSQDNFIKVEASKENAYLAKLRVTAEEVILLLEFMITHLYQRNKEADSTIDNIKKICVQNSLHCLTLESIPEHQNTHLDEINYLIASIAQNRDRILQEYEEMLSKYHIHKDDTGFKTIGVGDILKTAVSLRVLVNENSFE